MVAMDPSGFFSFGIFLRSQAYANRFTNHPGLLRRASRPIMCIGCSSGILAQSTSNQANTFLPDPCPEEDVPCDGDDIKYNSSKDACNEAARLNKLIRKWCGKAGGLQPACNSECRMLFYTADASECGDRLPGELPQQYCRRCAAANPHLFPNCSEFWAADACCDRAGIEAAKANARCLWDTINVFRRIWRWLRPKSGGSLAHE